MGLIVSISRALCFSLAALPVYTFHTSFTMPARLTDTSEPLVQILRNAQSVVRATEPYLKGYLSTPSQPDCTLNLVLPPPPSILTGLMATGVSRAAADRLSEVYIKQALKLKDEYEKRACKTTMALPSGFADQKLVETLRSAFTNRYQETVRQWGEKAILMSSNRVKELTQEDAIRKPVNTNKPLFNQV